MLKTLWISFFFIANLAMAEVISGRIVDVESSLLKLDTGRVVFLKGDTFKAELEAARGATVELNVGSTNSLESVFKINQVAAENFTPSLVIAEKPAFEPTVISQAAAKVMFNRLNPKFKRISECSDRAHVWSYDEFKNNGIKTQKVFTFFTASYITRNRFKWWFHVAPLVSVAESDGSVGQRVLDYRYTDRPVPIKTWTDLLVYSKRACKMTDKFSEYDVNPQTEDCYMMIDSMYYHSPEELADMENQIYRSGFNDFEVSGIRGRAFRKGNL